MRCRRRRPSNMNRPKAARIGQAIPVNGNGPICRATGRSAGTSAWRRLCRSCMAAKFESPPVARDTTGPQQPTTEQHPRKAIPPSSTASRNRFLRGELARATSTSSTRASTRIRASCAWYERLEPRDAGRDRACRRHPAPHPHAGGQARHAPARLHAARASRRCCARTWTPNTACAST